MEFKIKCKFCGGLHAGTICPELGAKKVRAAVKAIETAPVTKGKGKPAKKAKGKKS